MCVCESDCIQKSQWADKEGQRRGHTQDITSVSLTEVGMSEEQLQRVCLETLSQEQHVAQI